MAGNTRPDRRQRTSRNATGFSYISDDLFNQSHAELIVVLPIISKNKDIRSHVEIVPPEGSLNLTSYIKCEDVRSISIQRLGRRLGKVKTETMDEVEKRLRFILAI